MLCRETRERDRKLCDDCSRLTGPNLHYYSARHEEWRAFREGGGMVRE
ncbi:hypothetical protein [Fimbriiglobus ruber]|uniref:Uncharacterized protein n=1 Tax=Fimbriiglobus ruber TaxID=1908690 RepID=A0A225DHG5_9BACT|nr:hypothetical protein [Fimbriiglobus ruber]OWK40892.1 hypothetical protein FRUB_04784 [Fimbriiglobus ruber]